jgi:hypothetical protein
VCSWLTSSPHSHFLLGGQLLPDTGKNQLLEHVVHFHLA